MSAGAVSWLTNAVQIGFVIGALAASFVNLPDMVPLRWLMAGSAILAAVSNLALLLASGAETAIAARFLTGLALAGVYPSAMKLIARWFLKGRGIALGCIIGALTLGSAFPHLVRAFTGGLDWRLVVVAASVATLGGALLMALFAEEGPHPFSRATFDPRQIGRIFRNRAVTLANIGYFGHMWELYAMWGWILAYVHAVQGAQAGLPGPGASLLTFAVIASGVLGCLLGGVMSDRIGRTATTALMMMASGFCALAIGFVFDGPPWLFIAVAVVWGVTAIGDSAQFSAIVTEVTDSRFVGTALALQLGLGFALTVITVRLVPVVAAALGSWQWAFLILAPGPIIGTIAILILRRLPEAARIAHGRR
jgi:MFS family permease